MHRPILPHGARGIEGDNFALQFGADKIVFVPRSAANGEHYTFHAGPASGVLDLHETQMSSGRSEQHRALFAMRRDNIPAVLGAITPLLSELLALLRPLRLGWLKHRHIGIARGIDLISDEDIAAATRKRKGRLQSTRSSMNAMSSSRSFWKRSTTSRTATSLCSAATAGWASVSRQLLPMAMCGLPGSS